MSTIRVNITSLSDGTHRLIALQIPSDDLAALLQTATKKLNAKSLDRIFLVQGTAVAPINDISDVVNRDVLLFLKQGQKLPSSYTILGSCQDVRLPTHAPSATPLTSEDIGRLQLAHAARNKHDRTPGLYDQNTFAFQGTTGGEFDDSFDSGDDDDVVKKEDRLTVFSTSSTSAYIQWEAGMAGRTIGRKGAQIEILRAACPRGVDVWYDSKLHQVQIKAPTSRALKRAVVIFLEFRESISSFGFSDSTVVQDVVVVRGFGRITGKGGSIKHDIQDEFSVRLAFKFLKNPPVVRVVGEDDAKVDQAVERIRELLAGQL
jgi:hypothetical protein